MKYLLFISILVASCADSSNDTYDYLDSIRTEMHKDSVNHEKWKEEHQQEQFHLRWMLRMYNIYDGQMPEKEIWKRIDSMSLDPSGKLPPYHSEVKRLADSIIRVTEDEIQRIRGDRPRNPPDIR